MEPHHANHYTHFLRRLDRVEEDHLELAMALYADHELLRLVLEKAKLPAAAERVAISLDSRHDGPFVIVTRTGAFVTCLGKDMRPGPMPIVTRPELEAAGRQLDAMREKLDRVRQLREEEARGGARWLAKLDLTQPMLAREDFENLQRWDPIFGRWLHGECLRAISLLHKSMTVLASIREARLTMHVDEALEAFWRLFWTTSNLNVVANVGDYAERCAEYDELLRASEFDAGGFSSTNATAGIPLVQTSARAIWASMRHVDRILEVASTTPRDTLFGHTIRDATLVAVAIGSACGRDRALELLRAPNLPTPAFLADFDREVKPIFLDALRDPEQAIDDFTLQAREAIAIERGGDPHDVPADVARALAITGCADWQSDPIARQRLARALPWLSVADASELFVPRAWCVKVPYSKEATLALVRSIRTALRIARPTTVRRAPAPDRNDRCACGSGQKYKRCCMRAPLAA